MLPTPNPQTTVERIDDEILVLDRTSHQVHHLNATAAFVYIRCDGATSVDEIVNALVQQFDVTESAARRDTLETLTKLTELGLITLDRS